MINSPSISVIASDVSSLQVGPQNGIGMIQIPTQRGEHGNPQLITSERGFLRYFGGHKPSTESDLPTYAILMARAGLPLYISRIGHYTDPADKSTLVGCKASGQQTGTSVTVAYTVQAAHQFRIQPNPANSADYLLTGAKITITGSAANNGEYTITSAVPFILGGGGVDIYVCETIPDLVTNDGYLTYYTQNFVIRAGNVGAGYNGSTATIQDAASGNATNCDIVIRLTDSPDDVDYIYQDVPRNATQVQLDAISEQFQQCGGFIKIGALDLTNGEIELTGGEEDVSLIVAIDYVGDQGEQTGVYAFDSVQDAFRLANFVPLADVDAAYKDYAELRKDIRAELGVPLGANASGVEAYLTPGLNSAAVSMNVGDAYIIDPRDASKQLRVPGVLAAFMSKLRKDSTGQYWLSAAAEQFNKSGLNIVKMGLDLGIPANKDAYDAIYTLGGNAISKQYGQTVYFGNRSLLLDQTKVTRAENIADLLVYIARELPKTVKPQHFQPNDPISWRAMYRLASAWITNVLVAGRAIEPTEGVGWLWVGDQNADTVQDATYNNQNNLFQGKYEAKFTFRPIASMEKVTLYVNATNQNITVNP